MARPIKQGLDYFPHDTDAVSDEKIEALRSLHGNDGYVFYFVLLERIYRTEEAELDISDAETQQILSRKVAVTIDKFKEMLKTSLKYGCFDIEDYEKRGVLTSNGIKRRSAQVIEKRLVERNKYKKKVSDAETTQETPQAKQSKAKQIITPNGDKSKTMYEEPIIQLDDNGEEIEVSKPHTGTFGKSTHLVAKYYCELLGKNVTGQHTAHSKELLKFLQGRYPKMTNEQLADEAIGAINHFNSEYKKKNISDWGLRKIIENYDK